jgi:hypothetical protein
MTWISGQYKLGVAVAGVTNVDLTYSPSTTAVAKASDVRWTKP